MSLNDLLIRDARAAAFYESLHPSVRAKIDAEAGRIVLDSDLYAAANNIMIIFFILVFVLFYKFIFFCTFYTAKVTFTLDSKAPQRVNRLKRSVKRHYCTPNSCC